MAHWRRHFGLEAALFVGAAVIIGFALKSAGSIAAQTAPTALVSASVMTDALHAALPRGHSVASAKVRVRTGEGLIFPGDHVIVWPEAQLSERTQIELLVLAIEPPLTDGDRRALLTFAGDNDTMERLRRLREEGLLEARLHRAALGTEDQDFADFPQAQVITKRFDRKAWDRRLARP